MFTLFYNNDYLAIFVVHYKIEKQNNYFIRLESIVGDHVYCINKRSIRTNDFF